jgi:hypothetical protein
MEVFLQIVISLSRDGKTRRRPGRAGNAIARVVEVVLVALATRAGSHRDLEVTYSDG